MPEPAPWDLAIPLGIWNLNVSIYLQRIISTQHSHHDDDATTLVKHKMYYTTLLLIYIIFNLASADVAKREEESFNALVEAVQKEGGYVHPAISIISNCPSGAPRGIGIVKKEKERIIDDEEEKKAKLENNSNDILMKIPYSYQLTRHNALSTLSSLIPRVVLEELPLEELDDAALLVLFLANEYGLGEKSKYYAYVNTLPMKQAQGGGVGCGWEIPDTDLHNLLPLLTTGGVNMRDIEAARNYSHRVSNGMTKDYGEYLTQISWPKEWKEDSSLALQWGLCIVASRGTGSNLYPGSTTLNTSAGIRLIPLADLINHQYTSGGYIELSGREKISSGDIMDASPDDAGAFVVLNNSMWKDDDDGSSSEITVNYNLPEYRAVDWFLSLGFVPPELAVVHDEL